MKYGDLERKAKKVVKALEVSDEQSYMIGKYQTFTSIFSLWIDLAFDNKKVFYSFLRERKVEQVAIYGYYDIGKKLESQLKKEGYRVVFAIDKNVGSTPSKMRVYKPEDDFPECDCIIITAYEANEIKKKITKRVNCPIYTLYEILQEEYNRRSQII